jgi:hypothetical protein
LQVVQQPLQDGTLLVLRDLLPFLRRAQQRLQGDSTGKLAGVGLIEAAGDLGVELPAGEQKTLQLLDLVGITPAFWRFEQLVDPVANAD